jgi:hypothetical protein
MIKPDELLEYMTNLLSDEQKANKKITELMPVLVKGIIKAVQAKN